MASILVVDGPNEGDYYPLERPMILVGRDEDCLIQITDEQVSRMHVKIWLAQDKSYFARDMKSANGTFVNKKPVSDEVKLANGDIIAIGNSELMFSELDFPDRVEAFKHYERQRDQGERYKDTMIT